jgi:hypothetical protein
MNKDVVFFEFDSTVSRDRQLDVLSDLAGWTAIDKVQPLKPGSEHPALSRLFYAYAAPGTDLTDLVERIRVLPEIRSASTGPKRKLV